MLLGVVQLIIKLPVVPSIEVVTEGTGDGFSAALRYAGKLAAPHPCTLYALTLNPYVDPAVSPYEPPVTEYVVVTDNGEYPTISVHVYPLVPASHSRKYDKIVDPPLLAGAVHDSSNLETVDVESLVGADI